MFFLVMKDFTEMSPCINVASFKLSEGTVIKWFQLEIEEWYILGTENR